MMGSSHSQESAQVQIAFADSVARQLGHAVAAQLVQHVAAVGVHGVLANVQLFGNLLGGAALDRNFATLACCCSG